MLFLLCKLYAGEVSLNLRLNFWRFLSVMMKVLIEAKTGRMNKRNSAMVKWKIMSENNPETIQSDPLEWLNEHGDILYRYAFLRLRNSELAEDVVQETFLSAIQSFSSFNGKASVRTWLIGILKNKIIDAYRKQWRETPQSQLNKYENCLEDELGYFNEKGMWQNHQPETWCNPKEHLNQKEFWNIFKQCNDSLPDRLREVFSLRELENLKSEEICQALNITATNFWKMMQRARVHLRQCLEKHWFSGPS